MEINRFYNFFYNIFIFILYIYSRDSYWEASWRWVIQSVLFSRGGGLTSLMVTLVFLKLISRACQMKAITKTLIGQENIKVCHKSQNISSHLFEVFKTLGTIPLLHPLLCNLFKANNEIHHSLMCFNISQKISLKPHYIYIFHCI